MVTMAAMAVPLAAVVAERQRAEAALGRVAAIVGFSDDAILSKTIDGVITHWNTGAERLYGYAAEEAIGQPVSLIMPPELPDELSKVLAQIRQGKRVDHYETVRMRKDGRRIEVSVTVSPVRDRAGRIVGASSIARDITERREVEAARREQDTIRSVASLAAGGRPRDQQCPFDPPGAARAAGQGRPRVGSPPDRREPCGDETDPRNRGSSATRAADRARRP